MTAITWSVFDNFGTLFQSISLFEYGIALAVIIFLIATVRAITKNKDHWPIMFSAFSWSIALLIPDMWWAGFIFGVGAVSLTFAFMPIIRKANDSNIFVLAIIGIIFNVLLMFGTGVWDASMDFQDSYDDAEAVIYTTLSGEFNYIDTNLPEAGLSKPGDVDLESTKNLTLVAKFLEQDYVKDAFKPITTALAIGTYIGKAGAFITYVVLAPVVVQKKLADGDFFENRIILLLIGFIVTLFEIFILYKVIAWVIGRYGLK